MSLAWRPWRRLAGGVLAAALLGQAAAAETLRVAVRNDAPPFASLADTQRPEALDAYRGFAVDVCREVFERVPAIGKIVALPVAADERFEKLEHGEADVLCGPTSVTRERLSEHLFTYPIFLSGVSFAVRSRRAGFDGAPRVGLLGGTTALSGVKALQLRDAFGDYGVVIQKALIDFDQAKAQELVTAYPTYDEGLDALCGGDVDYFVGDFDIIATLAGRREDCALTVSRRTITREVYGIVFGRRFVAETDHGLDIFIQAQEAIFAMYQDRIYEAIFAENFPDQAQSAELKAFFDSFQREVQRR